MTYYRIKQYCIKNGMPPGKAEYVRKLILRLVQQRVAENAVPRKRRSQPWRDTIGFKHSGTGPEW